MIWARKLLVGLFSIVLLATLIGTAVSFSTTQAFSKPAKVESWLDQSNLYDTVINNAVTQAQNAVNTISSSQSSASATLTISESSLKQAVTTVYPRQAFTNNLNTIIGGYYAWLEGHSKTPSFNIDLTSTKQAFANNLAQSLQTQLISLPACTIKQTKALDSATINPFTLTCLPIGVSLSSLENQISSELGSSSDFLANPVITADNLNPSSSTQATPLYQKVSKAPTIYRQSLKIPLVLAAASLICLLLVILISKKKRRGVFKVCLVLILSGLVLLAIKFCSDTITKNVDNHLITRSSTGEIQPTLINFSHYAEAALVKTDLDFAIGYIALALLVILLLFLTRKRDRGGSKVSLAAKPSPKSSKRQSKASQETPSQVPKPPVESYRQPNTGDSTKSEQGNVTTAPPLPKSKKRNILIQ